MIEQLQNDGSEIFEKECNLLFEKINSAFENQPIINVVCVLIQYNVNFLNSLPDKEIFFVTFIELLKKRIFIEEEK